MKKYLFILMAAGCLAVACEKKGEVLSPDDQKAAIEEAAVQAVQAVDLDNWKGTVDLITSSMAVMGATEPDDSMREWEESMEGAWRVENSGKDYPVDVIDLTKVKGEFSVVEGKLLRTNTTSGLSLIWHLDDENNTACKATATVKNSSQKVLIDEDADYEYDNSGNVTKETITYQEWLIVPSLVDVKLTSGKKTEARVKLTTDLNIAGDEPRPTDKMSATADITFSGYNLCISRAKYSTSNIELKADFKKGSTSIFSTTFSAKGKLAFEDDDDIDEMASDGKVNVSATLMGTVGLKGTLDWTACKKVFEADQKVEHTTEESLTAYATGLEKAVNVAVYVDDTAQARLGFEPVWEDADHWHLYTVIRFEDGSAYEMAEEFFSPNNYGRVIEASNALLAKITDYFNPEEEHVQ